VQSITSALGWFAADLRFEDIPREAVDKAKVCILDILGIAMAGSKRHNAKIAMNTALQLGAPGKAAVWMGNNNLRAIDAVLPNSVAAHCILQDDWLPISHAHIGAVAVPTAIAVCEEEGRSGRALIAAIVAAYDVEDRAGQLSVAAFQRGFRPSSVYAYFGAAAAAGKLMALDAGQMTSALGCAGSICGGILQPWTEGSMEWSFQEAFACRNGITAALLARNGLSGSRQVFEGPYGVNKSFSGTNEDERSAITDLGQHFRIVDTCFKRFPTGGANQGSAAVSYLMRKKHTFDYLKITKVEVDIPKAGTHERMNYAGINYTGPYHNFDQCLISKQFAIAMNLKTGDVRAADIERERNDPEFLALVKKIHLREVDDINGWNLRMRIFLEDGSCIEGDGGDIDQGQIDLSWDAAVEKFLLVTEGIKDRLTCERIIETVKALTTMDSVADLTLLTKIA
jgi:2-methylcitrate dehydratase PrpD